MVRAPRDQHIRGPVHTAAHHHLHRPAHKTPGMAAPRATFRKQERLTGRDAINTVMRSGTSVTVTPFRLVGVLTQRPSTAPVQVAFAVPKRHVRHATDRNRIRRQMREAYRLNKETWYTDLRAAGLRCDWLLICQTGKAMPYAEVQERLSAVVQRWMNKHLPTA